MNNNIKNIIITSSDFKRVTSKKYQIIHYSKYLDTLYKLDELKIYLNFNLDTIKKVLSKLIDHTNEIQIASFDDFMDIYELCVLFQLQNGAEIILVDLNNFIKKVLAEHNWFEFLEGIYKYMYFEDLIQITLDFYYNKILTSTNLTEQSQYLEEVDHDLKIMLDELIIKKKNASQ